VRTPEPRQIIGRVTVLVRPEAVTLRVAGPDDGTVVGRVAACSYLGTAVEYRVEAAGELLRVRLGVHEGRHAVGDLVHVELDDRGVVLIAPLPRTESMGAAEESEVETVPA
jgi:ABC-type Fe3+/spermidine/putrescine transport system ATPase subunit